MRIAIMAAGAVGGYFGARLAKAGHDVVFIARGAHLDAIRTHGLKIESVLGDLHLRNVNATDDLKSVGPVDVVMFAVKLWDTETAGEQTRALLGPDTRVVTLQNGVDSVERLVPILGSEHVVGGTTHVVTVMPAPGVIRQTSPFAQFHCGRPHAQPDAKLQAFVDAARAASIDAILSDDIERDRWLKFIFLAGTSGVTASTRMPLGPVMADPDTRAFFRTVMQEVHTIARAKGIRVPDDYIDRQMAFAAAAPPTVKASQLNDLEAGNRLELDWLAGKVVALGRELSIPTPANEAVYAVLKLHRMGRKGG
jgi:2-dehydropantoate 2-reductase